MMVANAVAGPKEPDMELSRPQSTHFVFSPALALTLLCAAMLSPSSRAAAPAAIPLIGATTFAIDGRGDPDAARACGVTSGAWNRFELLLDQPAKPVPASVAVLAVVVNGSEPAGVGDALRLAVVSDQEPLLKLRVCADADRLQIPGTWTVQALVHWPDDTPTERSFAFSIVRRPAAVQVPAGFSLELDSGGGFAPNGIPVQETSGESSIRALKAVADPIQTAETSALLEFPTPAALAPRGNAVLVPKLIGTLPLGFSATRIVLSAPELGPPTTVTIRVLRRLCVGWLLAILTAGVAIGYGTRVALATRNAKAVARLNASREAVRIQRMADADPDPVVRQTLMQIVGALMADSAEALSADTIDKAVAARRAEADAIAIEARRRREELRGRADDLRAVYDPPGGVDPSLRALADPVRTALLELLQSVKDNILFESEQKLDTFDRWAKEALIPGLDTWKGQLDTALTHFNGWMLTPRLTKAAESLRTALSAEAVQTLSKADTLARKIREWLIGRLPGQTSNELRTIGNAFSDQGAKTVADLLRSAADRLDAATIVPSAQSRLAQLIEDRARLRGKLGEALVALARPDVAGDVDAALRQGDCTGAVAKIDLPPDPPPDRQALQSVLEEIAPSGATALLPTIRAAAGLTFAPELQAASTPIVLPLRADYAIVGPTAGLKGAPIKLKLLVPAGQQPPQPAWEGEGLAVDAGDPLECVLTATRVGFADVKVRVGGNIVARTTIAIGADSVQRSLLHEILLEDIFGTLLSGAIAIFVGWVIFGPGWVGTSKDMAIAFFWAFSVDLGLSRLRDITVLGPKPVPGGGAPA